MVPEIPGIPGNFPKNLFPGRSREFSGQQIFREFPFSGTQNFREITNSTRKRRNFRNDLNFWKTRDNQTC